MQITRYLYCATKWWDNKFKSKLDSSISPQQIQRQYCHELITRVLIMKIRCTIWIWIRFQEIHHTKVTNRSI